MAVRSVGVPEMGRPSSYPGSSPGTPPYGDSSEDWVFVFTTIPVGGEPPQGGSSYVASPSTGTNATRPPGRARGLTAQPSLTPARAQPYPDRRDDARRLLLRVCDGNGECDDPRRFGRPVFQPAHAGGPGVARDRPRSAAGGGRRGLAYHRRAGRSAPRSSSDRTQPAPCCRVITRGLAVGS